MQVDLVDCNFQFLNQKRLSALEGKAILLILGGRKPSLSFIKKIATNKIIFAADRGLEICKEAGLVPQIAFGDFDSVGKDTLAFFQKQQIDLRIYPQKKDLTDSQIALEYIKKHFKNHPLIITGAFGGRYDHFFSLFYSSLNLPSLLTFVDDKECIIPLRKGETVDLAFQKKPAVISLLPLSSKVSGVSISNVLYTLEEDTLKKNFPYAISNEILEASEKISVKIESGTLGIYLAFEDIKLD